MEVAGADDEGPAETAQEVQTSRAGHGRAWDDGRRAAGGRRDMVGRDGAAQGATPAAATTAVTAPGAAPTPFSLFSSVGDNGPARA